MFTTSEQFELQCQRFIFALRFPMSPGRRVRRRVDGAGEPAGPSAAPAQARPSAAPSASSAPLAVPLSGEEAADLLGQVGAAAGLARRCANRLELLATALDDAAAKARGWR